jgi:hypothetical protein
MFLQETGGIGEYGNGRFFMRKIWKEKLKQVCYNKSIINFKGESAMKNIEKKKIVRIFLLLCMIVIGCCSCGGIREHDDSLIASESAEFDKELEVIPVAEPDSHDIESALSNEINEAINFDYTIKNSSIDLNGKAAEYVIELTADYEKYKVTGRYRVPFHFFAQSTARSTAGWRSGEVKKEEENVQLIDMDKWTEQDWFEWTYWRGFVNHSLEVEDCGDHYNLSLILENDDETFFKGEVEIEKEGYTRDEKGNIVLEFPDSNEFEEYPSLRISIHENSDCSYVKI